MTPEQALDLLRDAVEFGGAPGRDREALQVLADERDRLRAALKEAWTVYERATRCEGCGTTVEQWNCLAAIDRRWEALPFSCPDCGHWNANPRIVAGGGDALYGDVPA